MRNLNKRLADVRAEAQKIQDTATTAGRPKTEDEQASFDALVAEASTIKAAIADQDAASAFLADAAADDPEPTPGAPVANAKRRTPGDIVTNSDVYKAMKAANPGGATDRPQMGKVSVGGFLNAVTVTGESTTPPLYVVAPASLSAIDIFDAVNVVEDAPDTIRIFRTVFDNDAAVVAPGVEKPESDITITSAAVNLETIAHHTPVNNQTLWHNALLRNRIDVHMINGVRAKAQSEVAGELLDQVAIMQEQTFETDIATTLRRAITKAQLGALETGADPSNISVAMSPADHENLDIELLEAMVAMAGQELSQTARIWRARVVPLYGLTEGSAFVGDLKSVDFYVGMNGITVTTGWINDQFIKNQVTILGEMECKAAVINGAALVATTLTGS